jgi:DNA-binding NarL/FixJ family response regulator
MHIMPGRKKPSGAKHAPNGEPARPLSPREMQVLHLIVQGYSNKQTAAKLGVTEATAKDHRRHIREKLGIHDLPTLTRYAISIGMIESSFQ